jgi:hypothetical protein
MQEHTSVGRAIWVSFLGLIVFYLVGGIVSALLTVVGYLIYQVKALRFLLGDFWFGGFFSQDSLLAPLCGYFVTSMICRKLSKGKETADLACVLIGAYLLIISVICLILNLMYGNSVWINIAFGIAGVVFIVRKSADF